MKLFGFKPENMKAKLLEDAQRRLIEAEHMESRWKHAANQAREEVARLEGQTGKQYITGIAPADSPVKGPVIIKAESIQERSFIGQAKS